MRRRSLISGSIPDGAGPMEEFFPVISGRRGGEV